MILYEGTNHNINMFFRNSVPEFLRLVDEILKEEIRIFFKYLLWDNLKISRFFSHQMSYSKFTKSHTSFPLIEYLPHGFLLNIRCLKLFF